MLRARLAALFGVLTCVNPAWAADETVDLHPAAVLPFVLLLLAIAVLPIVAGHFWHSNLRKALVAAVLSAPIVGYLFWHEHASGEPAVTLLEHAVLEYADFIVLLASLYIVAGGIVLEGQLRASALTNTLLLAVGAVLANFIGTTGASMLLIRPFLRINATRQRNRHLPVFFIFIVSNLGGLLTPLGDPPLFLGFLRGVDFFWTMSLTPHWLVAVGGALALFFVWDAAALGLEPPASALEAASYERRLTPRGTHNFLFLAGILAAVLLQSQDVAQGVQGLFNHFFTCPDLHLVAAREWVEHLQEGDVFPLWGGAVMIAMSLLSLLFTSRGLRRANDFTWYAIVEVAVLFAGIFITMVPALVLLASNAASLGIDQPWQFFWLTGSLSSFLDNAPTYLTFATIASHGQNLGDFSMIAGRPNPLLQAISCGAVFMGAMTYIGNGPNFMVKAIAEASGYRTPSFFGYMLYSVALLGPIFVLVTWLFFPLP
jgi:Na+/H+ antiporter NhaD/arsenite permease-like protein